MILLHVLLVDIRSYLLSSWSESSSSDNINLNKQLSEQQISVINYSPYIQWKHFHNVTHQIASSSKLV